MFARAAVADAMLVGAIFVGALASALLSAAG
jgi:hypothetical protein